MIFRLEATPSAQSKEKLNHAGRTRITNSIAGGFQLNAKKGNTQRVFRTRVVLSFFSQLELIFYANKNLNCGTALRLSLEKYKQIES